MAKSEKESGKMLTKQERRKVAILFALVIIGILITANFFKSISHKQKILSSTPLRKNSEWSQMKEDKQYESAKMCKNFIATGVDEKQACLMAMELIEE